MEVPEVTRLVHDVYAAMRSGDADRMGELLSEDVSTVIGVNDAIIWNGYKEACAGFASRFADGLGLDVRESGELQVHRLDDVCWFDDRPLLGAGSDAWVLGRFTGVVRLEADGQWRVVQWHASLGTPVQDIDIALPLRRVVTPMAAPGPQ
ncbi:nuclear transport factor 2 family protein [Oryzihumus sp.]|uniref:nuclear transport factor 2 family protein n=1 Tax=Oryzihumus sp. TaxID=1968903 RepID=UPI002EDB79C2